MPTRYVNTASSPGGDGTTNNTSGSTRAYASLSDAEAGLPADITSGGNQGVWTIWCEGSSEDTTSVNFSGTTTSATYYIEVKTDPNATYGRHAGVWSDSKYRLNRDSSGTQCITLTDLYVRITGLQLKTRSGNCIVGSAPSGSTYGVRVSSCILVTNGGTPYLDSYYCDNTNIWNCILYDLGSGTTGIKFLNVSGASNNVYNCTIVGFSSGVYRYGTTTLKNVLFSGCTNDVTNGSVTDTYCATTNNNTKGLTAGGTGNRFSQTFTFVDSANRDYHLQSSDAGAKDYGVSDPGSGLFSDDIDGQTRSGSWDIGADEYVAAASGGWLSRNYWWDSL